MIDFMPPHQFTVVKTNSAQGQRRPKQQRVGFYGCSIFMIESSPFSCVPLFLMSEISEKTDSHSKKPVNSFRLRGITATVFENISDDGKPFYKVTLQRSFKQNNEWKSTNSFGRDDLPILSLLTKQAWEFILNTESKPQ